MAILEGTTPEGALVPVQVTDAGRVVAEGLQGPEGPQGPQGPPGQKGDKGDPGAPGDLWSGSDPGNIYYTGGNVGIGLNSPGTPLEVQGDNGITVTAGSNSATGTLSLIGRTSAGAGSAISRIESVPQNTSNGAALMQFSTRDSSNVVQPRMAIDSSGRLLVGTASNGENVIAAFQGFQGNSTGQGIIAIKRGSTPSGANTLGQIRFNGATDNSEGAFITASSEEAWSGTSTPGRLVFSTTAPGATSPTERMRINSQGDVTFQGAPIIKSPDGTNWKIVVDNNGNLSATQ